MPGEPRDGLSSPIMLVVVVLLAGFGVFAIWLDQFAEKQAEALRERATVVETSLGEATPSAKAPTEDASSEPAALGATADDTVDSDPALNLAEAENPVAAMESWLLAGGDRSVAMGRLVELREALARMPTEDAVAMLQAHLASGRDIDLGQFLRVHSDGTIGIWPSYRAFLLDVLAELDLGAALEAGEAVFAGSEAPADWVIALRNMTLGLEAELLEDDALLRTRTETYLAQSAWAENPTPVYLEGFDLVAYNSQTELVPLLGEYFRPGRPESIRHASFVTLDRLTWAEPADVLTTVLAEPDLMAATPEVRAQLVARADLANAQQRDLVESYLANPELGEPEAIQFLATIPNLNFLQLNGVATGRVAPDGNAVRARAEAALRWLRNVQGDPRFDRFATELAEAEERVAEVFSSP